MTYSDMFNLAYGHKGQVVLRMWVWVSAAVTKTKKKRKEVLTDSHKLHSEL